MTVYDLHLELDETEDFALMPIPLQEQLQVLSSEWPSFPALGTKTKLGRKIVHARLQYPNLTESVLVDLFTTFNLNWAVHGIREAYPHKVTTGVDSQGFDVFTLKYTTIKVINKALILPFIADRITVDPITLSVTQTPFTINDKIYLPLYAGTDAILV